MTQYAQRNVLDRFRRYQHLLMFGGGAVVTAVVLVAFVLNTVATVRTYVALEHQELMSGVNRLTDLNSRNVVLMQNGVRLIEVAWRAGEQAEPRLIEQFTGNGQMLRLQQAPDHLPVLVVGASSATPPDLLATRYIRLAKQISQAATAASERNGGLLTFWLYRPDRPLLILVPSPGDARMATLLADRAAFFSALAGPGGNLLVPRDVPLLDPRTGGRAFRWLPPYDSPLSGRRSVRVAATLFDKERKPFAVAVYELPVTIITAALGESGLDGSLMLFARNGQVITSFSRQPVDPKASDTARALGIAGIVEPTGRIFRDGHMLFGWPIGETGATLVFVQSWRSIARALTGQIGTSAATTGVILLVVWSLILLFNRRVFLPVLERSRRVFESEHLSRALIETAPVGLGLIAVESGKPLLRSPTMIEAAARVVLPAARTLSAELVHRHRQRADVSGVTGTNGMAQEAWSLPTREGGTMDLSVSVVPARYQGEDVLVTAFTDVTVEKRLNRQLREAKQAADSANAAKSAFLAAMSHEIRTPLNAILGNLELLSHSQLDALQRDRLKTIRGSSDGLLAIVSDVLDFSKIEAGEMTLERIVFDAQEVASRALTMFGPVARAKGVRLSGEFGTSTTQPMQGDPTRLGQVMNNLLSNAIKFSGHGEVTLRLSAEAGSDDQPELVIEVEDSGIGISPEQQAMLFRAFSQADTTIKRRFGGTGLGLALCARLTDAMGGTIAVHSVPGEGSLFTVRVPLGDCHGEPGLDMPHFEGEQVLFVAAADTWHAYAVPALEAWGLKVQAYRHPAQLDLETLEEADTLIVCGEHDTWHADDVRRLLEASSWMIDCSAEGPAYPVATGRAVKVSSYGLKGLAAALRHTLQGMPLEAGKETQRGLSRRLKVLVAEDNAVNRELFSEQLKMLGCEPQVAEDGLQALERLSRERFDVLVTDLAMPVLDGYGLVREAQARWPEMPIVVATASVSQEERARCEAAGVMRVVAKPLQLDELSATLSEVTGVPGVAVQAEEQERERKRDGMLGGRAMPAHVRATFLKSCEEALAAIHAAYDAGDAARILAELHSLRGALNVFGYRTLAEQCAQMEVAISKEGVGTAQDMIDAFDSQLSATILT
ncbi:ATP-binding protein [Paraburkholderia tuberum]|uniref:Sensory/regulatory protein RpfC n=1 Tax=Paraburkholderia tuberum TaxID=157910 RepID=A0A1H1K0K3_9BURK|nr:ATP-binding protein [Paraburkholderia tuberum]SDR55848.1 two-component system, NarL family, capsular synthesis sensor histidine kinase RcsC [Paraburkholderia tuberum]